MVNLSSDLLGKEQIVLGRARAPFLQHGTFLLLPRFPLRLLTLTDKTSVDVQAHKISHSLKISRLLPWWEKGKSVKAAAQDTCEGGPAFMLGCSFFLGASRHCGGNQGSFIRHFWHRIDPLKVVAFLEKQMNC